MLTSVTKEKLFTRLLEGKKVVSYNRLVEEREKFLNLIYEINDKSLTVEELGFLKTITPEQREKVLMTSTQFDLSPLIYTTRRSYWTSKRVDYKVIKETFGIEEPVFSIAQISGVEQYLRKFICLQFKESIPEFSVIDTATHECLLELQNRLGEALFNIFLKALKEYILKINETVSFLLMIDKLTTSNNVTMSVISKKFPELYEIYKTETNDEQENN